MILSGVLYNAGGPVSNARIIFTANKTSLNGVLKGAYREFETQEDGTYFLDLEPGYYYVAWYPSQGPLVRLGAVTADDVTMATLPAALSAEGQPVNPDIVTDEVQDALNQIQALRDETGVFAANAAASAASLNAADIVHAPLSGLANEAGTAYSRDVGTGPTQVPTNADLGDLAQFDTLSAAPVGDAATLQTALGVVNVADRGVAGGDASSNLASQPYVDTGLADKVDVGQVGFESVDTSTGTQTVAGALDSRKVVISPYLYGARDGQESTTALQQAFDDADAIGAVCDLGDGKNYICSQKLRLPRFLKGKSTLDFSGVVAGALTDLAEVAGTKTGITSTLSTDCLEGTYTVSVANGGLFSIDEHIFLCSDALYPGLIGTSVKKGEILRIKSITSNTLTLYTAPHEDYLTSDSAFVEKLDMVETVNHADFKILGPAIEGGGFRGARYYLVDDLTLNNTHSHDCDTYAIPIDCCTRVKIWGGTTETVRYTGAGTIFYGIAILNACKDVSILQAKGRKLRHHVVTTAGQTEYGEPLYVKAISCKSEDMMAGGDYASYGYQNHGYGRFVDFIACDVDSAFALGKCEGSDTRYIYCTGSNLEQSGIRITSIAKRVENFKACGNTFRKVANKTGGIAIAFDMQQAPGCTRKNIQWIWNTVEKWHSGIGTGDIPVYIRASDLDEGILVAHNTLIADPNQDATSYAARIQTNALFEHNRIIGPWSRGGFFDGDKVVSRFNEWHRDGDPGAFIAIRMVGDNNTVKDDDFKNWNVAVSPIGAPANTSLLGGTFENVSSVSDNIGTFVTNGATLDGAFNMAMTRVVTSGSITLPIAKLGTLLALDTEGGAAADELSTIPARETGSVIVLRPAAATDRVVTVKHNIGNIRLEGGADFVMDSTRKRISLISQGGEWLELYRSSPS